MPRKLLTIDEFRSSAKGGAKPDATVLLVSVAEPKMVDEASRKMRFCFSDSTVDRAGDTIDAAGWDTHAFMKNPVALFAHNSSEPPIGRASNVLIEDTRLMGDIEFMSAEISPFADMIYRMVKGGYLRAVSVGFLPKEYEWSDDDDREWGLDFKKQELLEISVVPVPANPNALIEARAKGIDTRPLVEWAEKVLDGGAKILVPRAELTKLRKAAKELTTMKRKTNGSRSRRRAGDGMNETDPADGGAALGSCGRKDDEECGMKNAEDCSVHRNKSQDEEDSEDKAALVAQIRQAVRAELKRLAPRRRADEGDEGDEKPEGDRLPEGHEERVRAAHAHIKAAGALYEAADDHHEKAEDLLDKAIDHIDDPEAEKSKADGEDEGDREECIRSAHAHMKSAKALTDLASEHHEAAVGLLDEAVDHIDNPEAEGGEKAQARARAKAAAAARRHQRDTDAAE